MCYAKAEEGNYDKTKMVPEDDPTSSGMPVFIWKGEWQEGVIVSIAKAVSLYRAEGWSAVEELWNENYFQANIK